MVTATDKILRKIRKDNRAFEPKSPIATDMFLPNHSGVHERFKAKTFTATLVTKTSSYSAANESTIICDATSGAMTITLPPASGVPGIFYNIKKIDSSVNAVTVDGADSETIDGATTAVLSSQYASITIQCDGSTWWII